MSILDRLMGRAGFTGPITPEDQPHWAAAQTMNDLCDLTIDWLEGRIQSQPGYYGPVDVDEDDAPGLTAALVALNRAGFLTYNSQAGHDGPGYDGYRWMQRAAVDGFTTSATVDQLVQALTGSPFVVDIGGVVPVTWGAGCRLLTSFGGHPSAREVEFLYRGCGEPAVAEVRNAVHVVLHDPQVGRNDLWPVLTDAVRGWSR